LGYIFIEKSLTGALLGFFIGGILGEVLAFFRKKSNQ
jgi:NhaP-type Na+/H+ or K+/H+ antiporter